MTQLINLYALTDERIEAGDVFVDAASLVFYVTRNGKGDYEVSMDNGRGTRTSATCGTPRSVRRFIHASIVDFTLDL